MKTKNVVLITIIVLIVGYSLYTVGSFVYLAFFTGYYNTPEDALLRHGKYGNFADIQCKQIIDTAWLGEEPVVFYESSDGSFNNASYVTKKIHGSNSYKIVGVGTLPPLSIIKSGTNFFLDMESMKNTNTDYPNMILFGVSRCLYPDLTINGEHPIFKQFEMEGINYNLWYITGSKDKLEFGKVRIRGGEKFEPF